MRRLPNNHPRSSKGVDNRIVSKSIYVSRNDNTFYVLIPQIRTDVRRNYPKQQPSYYTVELGQTAYIIPEPKEHKYVYIDDSSDSKPKTKGRFFIIVAVVVDDPERLEGALAGISNDPKTRRRKFTYSRRYQPEATLEAMERIANREPDIYIRIMEKDRIIGDNVGNITYKRQIDSVIQEILELDRSENFSIYADSTKKMSQVVLENLSTDDRIVNAEMVGPGHPLYDSDQMDVADFVAGSTGRAFNGNEEGVVREGDTRYFDAIKGRIRRRKEPMPEGSQLGTTDSGLTRNDNLSETENIKFESHKKQGSKSSRSAKSGSTKKLKQAKKGRGLT